ncbi:zinc ribbon domain-containing protein [Wukongibacter baidiensis]
MNLVYALIVEILFERIVYSMMLIPLIIAIALLYFVTMKNNSCDCYDTDSISKCNKCGSAIKDDYIYCPKCREKLKKRCEKCEKMIDITWRRCPFCE